MRQLSVNLGRCWYWLMTILRFVWAFFAALVGGIVCLTTGCLLVSAMPPDPGAAVIMAMFLVFGIAAATAVPTFVVWLAIDFLLVCLGADRNVIKYRDIFREWDPRRYKWCHFCGRKEFCEPKELPDGWTRLNQAGLDPFHAYDCGCRSR